jgi:hypothetical protein
MFKRREISRRYWVKPLNNSETGRSPFWVRTWHLPNARQARRICVKRMKHVTQIQILDKYVLYNNNSDNNNNNNVFSMKLAITWWALGTRFGPGLWTIDNLYFWRLESILNFIWFYKSGISVLTSTSMDNYFELLNTLFNYGAFIAANVHPIRPLLSKRLQKLKNFRLTWYNLDYTHETRDREVSAFQGAHGAMDFYIEQKM